MFETGFALWLLTQVLLHRQPAPVPKTADFARDVRPILEKRCQPCHFPGGTMYARLPFDKPETIVELNTRLFSRIKKDEEQAIIRAFLATR